MIIGVTGTSGFLGSRIKNYFSAHGYTIFDLSYRPEKKNIFIKDIKKFVSEHPVDSIINAAASQLGKDDTVSLDELISSNIFMPSAILSIIKELSPSTTFINFGTSWQIGEDGTTSPFNAYAASKSAAESFFDHFALDGVRIASLRLYDTYGPSDNRNKIINLIADALINQTDLPMSGGEQHIDFVHIDDVLQSIRRVLDILESSDKGCHLIYDIRSGNSLSILELLDLIKKQLSQEEAPFIRPGIYPYRNRERFSLFPSNNYPPNWSPNISIEEGIKSVIASKINKQEQNW